MPCTCLRLNAPLLRSQQEPCLLCANQTSVAWTLNLLQPHRCRKQRSTVVKPTCYACRHCERGSWWPLPTRPCAEDAASTASRLSQPPQAPQRVAQPAGLPVAGVQGGQGELLSCNCNCKLAGCWTLPCWLTHQVAHTLSRCEPPAWIREGTCQEIRSIVRAPSKQAGLLVDADPAWCLKNAVFLR